LGQVLRRSAARARAKRGAAPEPFVAGVVSRRTSQLRIRAGQSENPSGVVTHARALNERAQ
jgi:hypothetical protein